MVALQELKDMLLRLGLKPGMKLVVHSKFSSFGGVEGGPEAFCRLLMDILTPEGTLMMPSFTFKIYEGKLFGQPFDYLNTPSDTGIVTEFFRKMPGVYRSADPCQNFPAMYSTTQVRTATGNSPAPNQAATVPAASAAMPALGCMAASIRAGKVITASVTYGT